VLDVLEVKEIPNEKIRVIYKNKNSL